jgi:hypothetical protein
MPCCSLPQTHWAVPLARQELAVEPRHVDGAIGHVCPEQQDWPLVPQTWHMPDMQTPSAPQEVPSVALIPVS